MTICRIRTDKLLSLILKKTIFAVNKCSMRQILKNIITSGLVLIFPVLFIPGIMSGQEQSDETFTDSGLDTDAYALAYGACKYKIARYYSDFNKDDQQLKKEFEKIQRTYDKFAINLNSKYRADENMFQKFERKVKTAAKHLPTCIRYENILQANENLQKAKAEKSGTTN